MPYLEVFTSTLWMFPHKFTTVLEGEEEGLWIRCLSPHRPFTSLVFLSKKKTQVQHEGHCVMPDSKGNPGLSGPDNVGLLSWQQPFITSPLTLTVLFGVYVIACEWIWGWYMGHYYWNCIHSAWAIMEYVKIASPGHSCI